MFYELVFIYIIDNVQRNPSSFKRYSAIKMIFKMKALNFEVAAVFVYFIHHNTKRGPFTYRSIAQKSGEQSAVKSGTIWRDRVSALYLDSGSNIWGREDEANLQQHKHLFKSPTMKYFDPILNRGVAMPSDLRKVYIQ